jgi:hypothetical protein
MHKHDLTLYTMPGFDRHEALLKRLAEHSMGKSCFYIRKLKDVDKSVLKELVQRSVEVITKT